MIRWERLLRFLLSLCSTVIAVSIVASLVSEIGWYLAVRSGIDAPFFFYNRGPMWKPIAIHLLTLGAALIAMYTPIRKVVNRLGDIPPKFALWLPACLALVIRVCVAWVGDASTEHLYAGEALSDEQGYLFSAEGFLRGDFPWLFCNRGHVGLLWVPLVAIFGTDSMRPMALLAALLGAYRVWLTGWLVLRWFGRSNLALLAGLMLACHPLDILECGIGRTSPEIPFSAFLMTAIAISFLPAGSTFSSFASGLVLGLSHFLRACSFIYWPVVCVLPYFVPTVFPRGRALRLCTVSTIGLAIPLLWLSACNYRFQGEFSPSYQEARGYVFYLGAIPFPRGYVNKGYYIRHVDAADAVMAQWNQEHPGITVPWGDVRIQKLAHGMALSCIAAEPKQFLWRVVSEKWPFFWIHAIGFGYTSDLPTLNAVSIYAADGLFLWLAVALLRLVTAPRSSNELPGLIACVMSLFLCLGLHSVVDSYSRYQQYLYPLVVIIIARAIVGPLSQFETKVVSPQSP